MQEPVSSAPLDAKDHAAAVGHAVPGEQAPQPSPDMPGQLIHQKSAKEIQNKLEEGAFEHSRRIMPLTGHYEKTGKAGRHPAGTAFSFSRLCDASRIFYADVPMSTIQRPTHLKVIWETVPDPDPHALLKAVAMLFNRRVPLSTTADLTRIDEELSCRRLPEP